jgi:hypothetical protein
LRAGVLMIGADALFTGQAKELGALALRHRVPAIYQYPEFTAGGGLMSYGGRGRPLQSSPRASPSRPSCAPTEGEARLRCLFAAVPFAVRERSKRPLSMVMR